MAQVLDALTSNPEVFSKTALFLMFDENDGLFDHMVPPTPPQSRAEGLSTIDTTNEVFAGDAHFAAGPYGLGVRVPMIVISPWSKGGWVCSELFDHTSLIKFVERRFGGGERVRENNITRWRRAVVGDLTSAFDFRTPNHDRVKLPSTDAFVPPDTDRHPDYKPAVPAQQSLPRQEPGMRPARAVPYELHVVATADAAAGQVALRFANTGDAAAVFQVRSGSGLTGPWTYTVGSHDAVGDTWDFRARGETTYDLSVYGPNGFFRSVKGSLADRARANVVVEALYDPDDNAIIVEIRNRGGRLPGLQIADAYSGKHTVHVVEPGEILVRRFRLERSSGWYDITLRADSDAAFEQRIAGHLETGNDSMSDPQLGR